MSFFDDTKKIGLALWVIGILTIFAAVIKIYFGLTDEGVKADDTKLGWIAVGISGLISAFIFIGYGQIIRSGQNTDKFATAMKLVFVIAITFIIKGAFDIVSGFGFHEVERCAMDGAIVMVFGLIILFVHRSVADGNAGTFGKVLLIAVLAASVLMVAATFLVLGKFNDDMLKLAVGIAAAVSFLTYVLTIAFLLEKDVKAKLGM